ncbi:MAG TPA: heavy metal-associated domain-containing protein [Chitinophagaceae bacterium]|nr:heavy metal-associated domain-containing protein [Chitinophagaceae bacterium]
MILTYDIGGMGCSHCVIKVEKALKAVPKVSSAEVSLQDNLAVVTMEEYIPESRIHEAVAAAGHYEARERITAGVKP